MMKSVFLGMLDVTVFRSLCIVCNLSLDTDSEYTRFVAVAVKASILDNVERTF